MSASLLVAALAAFSAGVLSGFTGFGLAAVVVPLLLVVYEPKTVVALVAVLSLSVAAAVVLDSWREADRRPALVLLVAALPGLLAGAELLRVVDPAYLKLAVGALVVVAALLFVRDVRLPGARTRWGSAVAGFASGTLATSTGLSGPPAAVLLEERGLPKRAFRATISLYFLGLDLALLCVLFVRGLLIPGLAALAPGLLVLPALLLLVGATLAGKAAGTVLLDRVSPGAFRAVVLGAVVLTGALGVATAARALLY